MTWPIALSSPRQALPEPHRCQDQLSLPGGEGQGWGTQLFDDALPDLFSPPQGEGTGGRLLGAILGRKLG
jgi:hypothetical protein